MLHLASALLTLTAGPATPPPKTIVPPMFYSEIVKQSQQIVTGTVTASKCQYERGKESIVTYVTFSGLTVHKGKIGKTMTLRFVGGKIGDDNLTVALMPEFKVGSKYLVYVDGLSGKKVSSIVGFYQGAFELKVVNSREVLLNTFGQQLIGIQKDRFVFADKPGSKPPVSTAPQAVNANSGFKPAHPNVDAMEMAEKARQDAKGRAEQKELPIAGYGNANVKGPASEAKIPKKAIRQLQDAVPLVIPASSDRGIRMSVKSLLSVNVEVK